MRDEVFKNRILKFSFDKEVASSFDDMACRSIPFYNSILDLTCYLAKSFFCDNKLIYDLGCSTGNTCLKLLKHLPHNKKMIVACDSSKEMLEKAKKKLSEFENLITFIFSPCEDLKLSDACFVILNWTLQFVAKEKRLKLLKNIYQSLNKGGGLMLSEKIQFKNKDFHSLYDDLYCDFKRSGGYSQEEIDNKKHALTNVLVPLTKEENFSLLEKAGFSSVELIFQWGNFISFLAIK